MKILVVTNPANDGSFRLAVDRLMADGPCTLPGLLSGLLRDYPRVAVVRGIEDRNTERWYAYRDGHWVDSAAAATADAAAGELRVSRSEAQTT